MVSASPRMGGNVTDSSATSSTGIKTTRLSSIPIMYSILIFAALACSVVNYLAPTAVDTRHAAEMLADTFLPQRQTVKTVIVVQNPPRRVMKVPKGHEKTFYYDGKAISFAAARALRSRGWQRVNDESDAHLVFFYSTSSWLFKDLKPWQRFNHIPKSDHWNSKDKFIQVFKDYEYKSGVVAYFLPESYRLGSLKERKAFRKRISQGGMDYPWVLKEPDVNQGKGIEMIAPNSKRLKEIADRKKPTTDYIIQRYICNEMTWNHRKFDVRMFWFVASLDPLVVLYQDGYARIGNSVYREDDFGNTVSHLTTHTGLGEEGKADFEAFSKRIVDLQRASPGLAHIDDPVQHVKSQFKESLAEFVAAFKDKSFSPSKKQLTAENGFGFYGADFILDNDLDVWLIEPQKGCGMDEDYDFRVTMHDRLFRGMIDTIEEVWQKQEKGLPLLPLENIGDWEVIYADGWRFSYDDYERSQNKKSCNIKKESKKVEEEESS